MWDTATQRLRPNRPPSSSTPRPRQIKLRAASSLSQPRPISANWQVGSGRPAAPAFVSHIGRARSGAPPPARGPRRAARRHSYTWCSHRPRAATRVPRQCRAERPAAARCSSCCRKPRRRTGEQVGPWWRPPGPVPRRANACKGALGCVRVRYGWTPPDRRQCGGRCYRGASGRRQRRQRLARLRSASGLGLVLRLGSGWG